MEVVNYTVKIHPAIEGGYWAEVPALPGCFTQGASLEEVMARAKEAIECYLSSLMVQGEPFPVERKSRRRFAFPVTVRTPRLA